MLRDNEGTDLNREYNDVEQIFLHSVSEVAKGYDVTTEIEADGETDSLLTNGFFRRISGIWTARS